MRLNAACSSSPVCGKFCSLTADVALAADVGAVFVTAAGAAETALAEFVAALAALEPALAEFGVALALDALAGEDEAALEFGNSLV